MRIALIKTGALGDVVRTTALLPGLRRAHREMHLTWVTAREALPLVQRDPDVARAVALDDPGPWRHELYDWVISLDDDRDACALASALDAGRLSGAHLAADGALAYTSDLGEWFGMGILRSERDGGLVAANRLKQANQRPFGEILYDGLGLPAPAPRPRIALPAGAADEAEALVAVPGSGRRVALNTGAGGRWRFKSWGESETTELARRLHDEDGSQVLILGGPAERERNARVAGAAGRPGVVTAPTDLDIVRFAALVSRCDLLVTSDSLALHLGLAFALPVVAFFGPTSDAEIDLYGRGEKVVTPLSCRRCYLSYCDVRPHCMESLSVDTMLAAARRWLGAPGPSGRNA